jgi:hypothetical protein
MEPLIIQGTEDTPTVILNPGENKFSISGRSLPEDVTTFYQPVINWLNEYRKSAFPLSFETKLEYFNTASSKLILDIFMQLEEIKQETGAAIEIKWFYDSNDEDMLEAGEEYKELVEDLFFSIESY